MVSFETPFPVLVFDEIAAFEALLRVAHLMFPCLAEALPVDNERFGIIA